MAGSAGATPAPSTSTWRERPRNCGGPMPEFRRGLGRFLPQSAERDLFHPSLEDLRADRISGVRLQIAIVLLWLDCWRVWTFSARPRPALQRRPRNLPPSTKKDRTAMFLQDVRRALRVFRLEPGF